MTDSTLVFEAPSLSISYPTALNMHTIYDSELSLLEQGGKDRSFEIALATGGAAIGLTQNFLKSTYAVLWQKQVPDSFDFITGVLCIGLFALAVTYYNNSRGIQSKISDLVSEIRARPRKGGARSTQDEDLLR